eukprot:scaffold37257_cov53-Phaeocystis_antarctica.AAC.1
MHAEKKVVLLAMRSRRTPEALWRGAGVRPPPRPRTPSQGEVCLHEITRSNHTGPAAPSISDKL